MNSTGIIKCVIWDVPETGQGDVFQLVQFFSKILWKPMNYVYQLLSSVLNLHYMDVCVCVFLHVWKSKETCLSTLCVQNIDLRSSGLVVMGLLAETTCWLLLFTYCSKISFCDPQTGLEFATYSRLSLNSQLSSCISFSANYRSIPPHLSYICIYIYH